LHTILRSQFLPWSSPSFHMRLCHIPYSILIYTSWALPTHALVISPLWPSCLTQPSVWNNHLLISHETSLVHLWWSLNY
jgi:hypothetical protein